MSVLYSINRISLIWILQGLIWSVFGNGVVVVFIGLERIIISGRKFVCIMVWLVWVRRGCGGLCVGAGWAMGNIIMLMLTFRSSHIVDVKK